MSSLTLNPTTPQERKRPRWQDIRPLGIPLPVIILGAIIALAAALRFYNISAIGDANTYYTAAVKSMLQSWHNFFFVAAEPGGSVTVDKPPLGLWIQAASALIFGVNGFAVVLPQIVAGILSVPLLYWLVKRYFGPAAGLIAAFAQAVAPVAIAVERDNTMDATLILILLLAAWAFTKATETAKLKWLLLGGILVGLGFNTKMMQAFLPLPAFYGLYFLGAKAGWGRKIANLGLATVLMLVVSLSWAVAVDLTPADQRPYVGSSQDNSEISLALGYNGINRLVNNSPGGGGDDDGGNFQLAFSQTGTGTFAPPARFDSGNPPQDGRDGGGQFGQPPSDGQGSRGGQGGAFGNEIGARGVLRLFTTPLANEISWLLPLGLLSIAILLISSRLALPLTEQHQAAVLWGGWLLTEVVFFSAAGFFHAYYMAMLAPPLAALVGIGIASVWRLREKNRFFAAILIVGGLGTAAFQIWLASQYGLSSWWFALPIALLAAGVILLVWEMLRPQSTRALMGFAFTVAAVLVIPTLWAGLTTLQNNVNSTLPHAYSSSQTQGMAMGGSRDDGSGLPQDGDGNAPSDGGRMMAMSAPGSGGDMGGGVNESLLTYLEANTQDVYYLMAVSSSHEGDSYILETGRPVLLMGGFSGSDPVIDAAGLQKLVDAGQLRYILWGSDRGPSGGSSSIGSWLQSSCTAVSDVSTGSGTLYQCGS
jgi:4-amino-4-deoxy-L-arabinose transferase-like glycosyltransferase